MRLFAALYIDEDLSALVATLLRARGLDVLTTQEAGSMGRSDPEQLAYAASLGVVC
jgi:predicted nuclease of predicted toxin-antitoxin system